MHRGARPARRPRDEGARDGGLPESFLRVDDPQHHDQEQGGVPADLPELGLGPLERALHRHGHPLLPGARRGRSRPDHHRWDPCPSELDHGAAAHAAALRRPADRAAVEDRRRGSRRRLQARDPALALGRARLPHLQAGGHLRPRCDLVHAFAEPGSFGRVPRRVDAQGARRGRDRGDAGGLRQRRGARVRGRPRRGRAASEPRLPALAVHLAALQQAHRPLGRLAGEPPALPRRGIEADARCRRRRRVRRLPHQLDLLLAGRSRDRRRARHRRGNREAGGHRLRRRLGRRPSRLHPHADGVRGGLGTGLRPQDPRGLVEAGSAGRPHHHAGRGRAAARGWGRRCDLPCAPALHRPPLGQEGAGGPRRRHSFMCRRQLLLEEREPGRPGAVHLQPRGRPRGGVGRRHAGQGGEAQERAGHRRRAGGARICPHRIRPRPRRDALRGRRRDRRPRAGAGAAAEPGRVWRDRPLAHRPGREERHPHRHRRAGDGRRPGPGAGGGEARPRGDRHGIVRRRRRLPGLDRRGAARLGKRQLRRLGCGGAGPGPAARQGDGAGRPLRRGGAAHRRRLQGWRRRRGDAGHPLAHGGHGDHPRRLSRLDPAQALPGGRDGLRRSLRPPHRGQPR